MSTKPNSKKRLEDEESVDPIAKEVSKKQKKDKKKSKKDKSNKKNDIEIPEKVEAEISVVKKRKKKKSKKTDDFLSHITQEIIKEDASASKKKKDKKAKSSKNTVEEKESLPKTEEPAASDNTGWIDWSKTSFEDQTRKDKFLRLMGARKQENTSAQPQAVAKKGLFGSLSSSSFKPSIPISSLGSASLSAESQKKISADLEKQFEAAQRMKKSLQRGVKRGIGA